MNRTLRRGGAPIAAALAVAAAVASPAHAKVTFDGIGAIKLGMSEADVRAELGRPSSERTGGRADEAATLLYRRRKLEVTVQRAEDRVVAVKTTARSQRTASGLGIGSSKAAVQRRLRGEKCNAAAGVLVCSVERDGAVMDFDLRRGRVVRVSVTRANSG